MYLYVPFKLFQELTVLIIECLAVKLAIADKKYRFVHLMGLYTITKYILLLFFFQNTAEKNNAMQFTICTHI